LGRADDSAPQLVVLVRSLEQLRALRDQPVASVIADLEQPATLRAVSTRYGPILAAVTPCLMAELRQLLRPYPS
jgi:hypothetical protein